MIRSLVLIFVCAFSTLVFAGEQSDEFVKEVIEPCYRIKVEISGTVDNYDEKKTHIKKYMEENKSLFSNKAHNYGADTKEIMYSLLRVTCEVLARKKYDKPKSFEKTSNKKYLLDQCYREHDVLESYSKRMKEEKISFVDEEVMARKMFYGFLRKMCQRAGV